MREGRDPFAITTYDDVLLLPEIGVVPAQVDTAAVARNISLNVP